MSYYTFTPLQPYELARAGDVNERFEQAAGAFDDLPDLASIRLSIQTTVAAGGTGNAITLASAGTALTALALGQRVSFKATATNSGAATLNVDGLGAIAIKRTDGAATVAGDITSGRVYTLIYDGSFWQLETLTATDLATYTAAASTSATAAAASATAAAASASAAATSATNAANSATAAAGSASTASTQATNAGTSATAAASSATAAAASATAAQTAESNAETAETNAETAETNAAASAAAAAASATAASGSATTAAGHVTTASGHATNAANSATAAAGSATTAGTHATNAGTSATNAANSATAAANSAASINDANLVHVTGAESIAGVKTFSDAAVFSAGVQIGHATDTTVTRDSAGNLAVEGNLIYRAGGTDVPVTDGGTGASTAAAARSNLGLDTANIQFVIDGGGATITTGVKGDLVIPFACTITQWTALADQSGSIVIDIWKDVYGSYPPVVGDSITASAKPTISTATKGQSSTLTGWTVALAAGDIIRFNVDSVTTIQRVNLTLSVTR